MIDLNKEAEDYRQINRDQWGEGYTSYDFIPAFIAGANSKHVQAKILQAQIDLLNKVLDDIFWNEEYLTNKINELQQQLKELENAKN
jgi:uncharacterized circularly permuted ATP-grasp superfamily protein